MNRSMQTAARRQIAELEARVTQQGATRTLRVLENALALTRQHLQFALRGEATSAEPQGV